MTHSQDERMVGRETSPPPKKKRGRKPLLDEADRKALQKQVTDDPATPMAELVQLVAGRGKKVSGGTISKALKELGFARRKRRKAPSQPAPQTPPRYTAEHRREPIDSAYPSSLTDAEWDVLAPILAAVRDPRGRKPDHSPRAMINAVFYMARTGCQWRYLPKEFPRWTAVWSVFRRLRDSGTLDRLYDELFKLWRTFANRSESPTAGMVDSQTVKTTEKGGLAATTPARRRKGGRGTWSPM